MNDTYSAADAARVLGRSERLVRKLAAEGRLEIVSQSPLRLGQESVHRERNRRKPAAAKDDPAGMTAEQISALVKAAVAEAISEIVPRMLESRDAAEGRLVAELAATRQELERLRAEQATAPEPPAKDEPAAGITLRLPPLGWPFRR